LDRCNVCQLKWEADQRKAKQENEGTEREKKKQKGEKKEKQETKK
jgi:hypothetical protein